MKIRLFLEYHSDIQLPPYTAQTGHAKLPHNDPSALPLALEMDLQFAYMLVCRPAHSS